MYTFLSLTLSPTLSLTLFLSSFFPFLSTTTTTTVAKVQEKYVVICCSLLNLKRVECHQQNTPCSTFLIIVIRKNAGCIYKDKHFQLRVRISIRDFIRLSVRRSVHQMFFYISLKSARHAPKTPCNWLSSTYSFIHSFRSIIVRLKLVSDWLEG